MSKKEVEELLQGVCLDYVNDPYGFIMRMWDWNRGSLEGWEGPDWWHREVYQTIKDYLASDDPLPLRIAVASGHGAGKTFLSATLIHWFMSCRPHPQVVCTANTESQLTTKTWREIAKWHKMAMNNHWFEWTATSYFKKEHQSTWRANAIPWSENNTEAFAGTHEENVLVVFDEASKISDKIWEVTDGVLTTKKNIWVVFGNGTRNVGRFYDCFHKNKWTPENPGGWRTWNIDSRTCKAATLLGPGYLESLIKQYGGEDTDQARVRVLGQFPKTSTRQLISTDAVLKAQDHELDPESWMFQPKVIGVDVARFGENSSAIVIRQGRKVFPVDVLPKQDLMQTAHYVAEVIKAERPLQVFVDGSGIGAGVVDRLRSLNFSVVDVNGGNSSLDPRFLNKRAESWWGMKEFIEAGNCELPKDGQLQRELTAVEYDFTDKGRIRLDRKSDIMEEHGFSPDRADALALTFAYPIADFNEFTEQLEPPVYAD